MLDFYKRIDDLLSHKKKSQKDLSDFLQLTSSQIFSNWKQRNSIPSADVAVKIADYLDTSVEYLVTGNEKDTYKEKYDDLKSAMQELIDRNS